jgi:hypothetical protein
MRAYLAVVVCALLAGRVEAQGGRTWIVDAAGGAGSHATSIQAGEALAAHGDTVVIRAGRYRSFHTNKGITFLGEGAVVVVPDYSFTPPPPPAILIVDLPPTETVVLRGIDVIAAPNDSSQNGIHILRAFGRVVLHDVTVDLPPFQMIGLVRPASPALAIFDSGNVYISEGQFSGGPAIRVGRARCFCTDVVALGRDANSLFTQFPSGSYAAIELTNCEFSWSRGAATGGRGSGWSAKNIMAASPALVASSATIRIAGNGTTAVTAGLDTNRIVVPAMRLNPASLTIDPRVRVAGSNTQTPIVGGNVIYAAVASLRARGGSLGGTIATELVAPAGGVVALFLGLPGTPFVGRFGEQHIDLATLTIAAAGVQGPSELFPVDLPLPIAPHLVGARIALQGFRSDLAGVAENSNPAILVLR